MSAEPAFEPDRVVAALNAADVAYVIVGGLAAGAHGVVRATRDIDIVAAPDQRNMDRLAACLRTLGGEHPVEGPLTGAALVRPASFKVQTRHGEVQVLNRMLSSVTARAGQTRTVNRALVAMRKLPPAAVRSFRGSSFATAPSGSPRALRSASKR
jgi:hypothetical protein